MAIQAPTYGDEIQDRYTWLPKPFDKAVPNFLTDFGFGDYNTRTGLSEKERELLTVVLLAALGGAEVQVKAHVAGALKTGSTREEVVCAWSMQCPTWASRGCSTPSTVPRPN